MRWVGVGVGLIGIGVGGNISVTGVLPRGDSSFSCQLAFRLCAFTKLKSTQKQNIFEVDLCTNITCTYVSQVYCAFECIVTFPFGYAWGVGWSSRGVNEE